MNVSEKRKISIERAFNVVYTYICNDTNKMVFYPGAEISFEFVIWMAAKLGCLGE